MIAFCCLRAFKLVDAHRLTPLPLIQVGDQIIEINQVNTKSMTHGEAIELIKQGGAAVRLLIRRGASIPQVRTGRGKAGQ